MKKTLLAIVLFPFLSSAQYTYKNLEVNFLEKPNESSVYTYGNLRIYPVRAKESFKKEFANVGKYMTLKEAIGKNKIKITESGNGGSVNNLVIENTSKDTIIIITGDVIKGGKQDRIVGQDIVLSPSSGKKNLPVYCVESGRWSSVQNNAAGISARNSATVSDNKSAAEFNGYYNKGSVSLRKVVEKEKDQSKVWSKVDELNSANKTETSTKTYTAMTQSADFTKKLDQYISFFKNKFEKDSSIVGVIVVTGNKVIGCDMFATHDLFVKQIESLLYSYATEAIVTGKPVNIATTTVKYYTDKLLANESVQRETLKEKGNSFSEKGKKLRVSAFD
jgi:hypothetical protein